MKNTLKLCGLVDYSLMASHIDLLSVCFLDRCPSALVKYLFMSLPVLVWGYFVFLLPCCSILCILNINAIAEMRLSNTLFHSLGGHFYLLHSAFWCTEILNFDIVKFMCFIVYVFGVIPNKSFVWNFCITFSSRIFVALVLTFRTLIQFC